MASTDEVRAHSGLNAEHWCLCPRRFSSYVFRHLPVPQFPLQ